MKMSAASAEAFDGFIARIGAVISGRRTYDVSNGWDGEGEFPALRYSLSHTTSPTRCRLLIRRTPSSPTGSPAPSGRPWDDPDDFHGFGVGFKAVEQANAAKRPFWRTVLR
jgi:hypothetical protein